MTDTNYPVGSPAGTPRVPTSGSGPYPEPSGWTGWIVFAATMMVLVGILHGIEGLVALLEDSYYLVSPSGLVVSVDYTVWGWVHLIFGVIVTLAGVALFSGRIWARLIGVCVALLSAIVNFAFIAAYPFWSVTLMAVDVLVVYALVAHGDEMRSL